MTRIALRPPSLLGTPGDMLPGDHSGLHSGEGRCAADVSEMRYVVDCDECREELREVVRMPYRPSFNVDGRPPAGG